MKSPVSVHAQRAAICGRVARAVIDSTFSRVAPVLSPDALATLRTHAAQLESREEIGKHPYAPVISLRAFRRKARGLAATCAPDTL